MENIILKHKKSEENDVTEKRMIQIVGLEIRNDEMKYQSDESLKHWYKTNGVIEKFMAQDIQRWNNQTIACTMYQ